MEEPYEVQTLQRMDKLWEKVQVMAKEFRKQLDPKSKTARSIDRGDCWSETASWARRDGHPAFAPQLDLYTLEFNNLVPEEIRY